MMDVPIYGLADAARLTYRATFLKAVAEGRALPLVLPYSILGAFIVPMLWLTVPHTQRPWLYRTRWLVVVFVVVFNLHIVRCSSSTNMAGAYGAGLMGAWGTVLNLNLLVWTKPQFEAARAIRRVKAKASSGRPANGGPLASGHGAGGEPLVNGLRKRNTEGANSETVVGRGRGNRAGDGDEGSEFEYVWEFFPAEAPFLTRLNWVADLTLSFRFSGWNCSISSVPRPDIPQHIQTGTLVDVDSIPIVSKSGYYRCLTEHEFLWDRLKIIAITYIALDFLAIYLMKDPFFILGPDRPYKLPPYLESVPLMLLTAYRNLFTLAGVLCAILAIFSASDLLQYFIIQRFYPRRAVLWFYASTFGSFSFILDKGLAGFWGASWHQTFRLQFLAPATYLLKNGYIDRDSNPGRMIALFVTFLQSGILHACGSASSIPQTKIWRSPVFFLLQAVGILVQTRLVTLLKAHLPLRVQSSRLLTQGANLVFVTMWLLLTAGFFVDDMASAGIWLLEPVPVSPLRLLGVGGRGADGVRRWDEDWWRWDRDHFPKWYSGRRWWESGIAV